MEGISHFQNKLFQFFLHFCLSISLYKEDEPFKMGNNAVMDLWVWVCGT